MCTIPFALWISNAAARFSGIRGAVSIQARRADCSRQAIYDQARRSTARFRPSTPEARPAKS